MKKWGIGFVVVLLFCIPLFIHSGTRIPLLEDSDTKVLLQTIRARNAPFSWFAGDWPLQNHFYRPLPTLAFELDNRLYGNNPAGYAFTNSLLALGCVLLLFWFFREFTNNAVLSTCAASLFACWVSGRGGGTAMSIALISAGGALLYAVRLLLINPVPWNRIGIAISSFFTLIYSSAELSGYTTSPIGEMPFRMTGWLPGRTASVMTLCALFAMAAYTRYERTSAVKAEKEPTPLDLPATKGTAAIKAAKNPWLWALAAIVGTALAFCSYEQAVMLPAALFAVAVALRLQGYKPRWGWHAAFWLCLVGYFVVRKELLPAGISQYQHQQLRFTPFVWAAIGSYIAPFAMPMYYALVSLLAGWGVLLFPQFYISLGYFAANYVAVVKARRRFIFAFSGWILSVLTFLPMAWVKHFEHYDFWPMAMRSLFTVTITWIGFDLLISAAMPQAEQAPARLNPAPGSLPRP